MVPLDAESLELLQRGFLSFPCSHPPSNTPVVEITVCAMVGGSWPRVGRVALLDLLEKRSLGR